MKKNKKLIKIEATLKNFSSLPLCSLVNNKNNLKSNPLLQGDNANYIKPNPVGISKKDYTKVVDMLIPTIFKKNVKNNSKLRPLNEIISDVGEIQYFPA